MSIAISKQKVSITPINDSSAPFTSAAYPIINFEIASKPAMLDTRTLKLNFRLKAVNSSGDLPSNVTNGAASALHPGNGVLIGGNRVSASSVIEQISISTLSGRSLETIRSYNRLCATTVPFRKSASDFSNCNCIEDAGLSEKSVTAARVNNQEIDVSIHLKCGLFSQQPLNISEKGLSGLKISIELAQNGMTMSPFTRYSPTHPNGEIISSTDSFSYEVSNVTLTYDSLNMSTALYDSLPSSGTVLYNSIQTMHSNIIANDQSQNLNIGSKRVISVTHSFCPTIHLNNRAIDSFRLAELENGATVNAPGTKSPVQQVSYLRGGILAPYDFILDSSVQASENSPLAQILEPAMNSVTLYDNHTSLISANTTNGILSSKLYLTENVATPAESAPDPFSLFILGAGIDSRGNGVDYERVNYTIRMLSSLDNRSPNSMFSYITTQNVLLYGPTGLTVIE